MCVADRLLPEDFGGNTQTERLGATKSDWALPAAPFRRTATQVQHIDRCLRVKLSIRCAARALQSDMYRPAASHSSEVLAALQVQHPEAEHTALLEPDPNAPEL